MAYQGPVENTRIGDIDESPPATDTAQSGLNGRLQRAAQRISSVLAKLPNLGQTTSVNSIPVTIASDEQALLIDGSAVIQPVSGTVAISNFPGSQAVSLVSLPLPTGASTSVLQTTGNNSLASVDTKIPALGQALSASSVPVVLTAAQIATLTPLISVAVTQGVAANLKVDTSGVTSPISAASLPLPSGASTAALQTTGNTSVASIDTKIPALVSGRLPVDGSGVTQPVSAATLPLPSGASTSALQTSGNSSLSSLDTKTPTLGQALAAASTPVVLTAAQVSTLTPLSSVTANAGTNLNTSLLSTEATLALIKAKTDNLDVAISTRTKPADTQTISGTIIANAGTNLNTSALALSSTQTDRTQKSQVTDGTRDGTIKAASTAAQAADTALVTAFSPNSPIPAGSAVIGALTANQSVNVAQIAGVATSTSASGIQKVGVVGNAGATIDSTAAAGSAPTNSVLTGSIYNTTVPAPTNGQAVAVQSDSAGSQYVNAEGRKATYRVVLKAFAPVASATSPFFSLQGSSTKTIRITKVRYTSTAATGGIADVWCQKFSVLTGGTSSGPTVGKMDSNNAAQTAVPLQYTVVSSTATAIGGFIEADRYETVTAAVTVQPQPLEWLFGVRNSQALVLRGTSEFFGLGISAIGTTPIADVVIEFIEE